MRIVAVAVRVDHVERILLDAAVAVVVLAHQPLEDDRRRAVDVRRARDDLGELRPVLHLVEIDAGQVQRLEDRLDRLRVLRRELLGERAHLLRMVLPHLLRRRHGEADAVFDGAVVPRLADAEAVHLVDLHVGDHLRRRNGDEADVLVRMDAAGGEPVAHPHRVRAGREGHRERERLAGGLGLVGERLDVLRLADAGRLQLVVQRDRLAVAIEQPRDHHRLHRRSGQPHRRGERHADEHVRRLVLAERQLVADDRPGRFLRDDRVDAELLEVAELVRHHDRRAVGQRDDAEADRLGLRPVVGVDAADPSGRQARHQHAGGRRVAVLMNGCVSTLTLCRHLCLDVIYLSARKTYVAMT